ncbi:EscU/YscU/HrcU family type III secretion system export apparatus switch protein [Tatumella ptyseos]|uniref:EscU/YscU/HrcU family type III secretion system export apparatus switch protein n=1 Tax=Tatumella ptyseos TaxID=82987 RepID=UPI0026ECEAB0|nr:EscU/YscU/HrcU family type III secretion system export apparatus switch protein [Tatumella ptyseos]WKX25751.1 EscU/YscU/HrcU family type III secretion system export apparatus switch protein [Tatumella ptyseos]
MAEKSEKPTLKRRKDSAKKGQTFKSKDLTTTIILLIGTAYIAKLMSFRDFISFYTTVLAQDTMGMNDFLLELTRLFFLLSLPFIGLCAVVGYGMTLCQTRFTIAIKAIKLHFNALNPIQGVKKLFSLRTVKECVKSICYLFILILTCYSLISHDLRQALSLYQTDLSGLVTCWRALLVNAILTYIGYSVFILVADFIVEYLLYFKELKMDKHEVKQEYKESEGHPLIKSTRRQAHQELLSGEEMAAVRNAEVVMANPTHIAIAIYFNPEVASLPFIAIRCTHRKAQAVIAYAEKTGVPVVRNIPLARKLYANYRQHSFILMNDEVLFDVMDILIWLRQVEAAGIGEN